MRSRVCNWFALAGLAALIAVTPACSEGKRKRGTSVSYPVDKQRLRTRTGVIFEVDVARTEDARVHAPTDLVALCETCGLVLAFGDPVDGRFSTENMQMNVDLVWMNRFTVVGIATDLKAPAYGHPVSVSLSPSKITEYLLLPAGSVEKFGIRAGEQMKFDRS